MDKSFSPQGSDTERPSGLLAGLKLLDRIPNWLGRLVQMAHLTEEEQRDAGIYFGSLTEEEPVSADVDPGNPNDG